MTVLVPAIAVGCGTGTAAVRDAATGRPVRLRWAELVLAGGVLHARGTVVGRDGAMWRVLFGCGAAAWCRGEVEDAMTPPRSAA